MSLRFHNTWSGMLEEFKPLNPPKVTMYHCGPTVYSFAHVGNFRTFLFGDLLRRVLERQGFEVTQVMNLTDVGHLTEDDIDAGEDKMARAAKKERRTIQEIATFYTDAFFEDLDLLGMKRAHHYPKASGYIPQMIEEIQVLEEKGFAYLSGDTVLFDTSRFPSYGRLSGKDIRTLKAGASGRVSEEELAGKRNAGDFRLWKVDPGHLMKWDSPWGVGYPGWHIECSTMSRRLLGDTIDIHTGGEDNIFPHHESEIAQAEAASGKPFCRYWLHVRHLMLENEKISKRLGNVYRVKDLEGQGFRPRAIRMALLSGNYRQHLNFTFDGIRAAQENIEKVENFLRRMEQSVGEGGVEAVRERASRFLERFDGALCDDLNVPVALAELLDFVKDINRIEPGKAAAGEAVAAVEQADNVLALVPSTTAGAQVEPAEIDRLIEDRRQARANRDWALADRIRMDLSSRGIILEDGPQGTTWRVKN